MKKPAVLDVLPASIQLPEPAILSAATDLLPDGSFGREWFVLTAARILVYTKVGESWEKRLDLPLAGIEDPQIVAVTGGGILEAKHGGRAVELVRYTNTQAHAFRKVAKRVERTIKGEPEPEDTEHQDRCPKCGLPLEQGTAVCPACTSKTRTLRRLVHYIFPYWLGALGLTALALSSTALGLVPPYLVKPFIDSIVQNKETGKPLSDLTPLLVTLVAVLLGSRILGTVMGALMGWLSSWVGNRITHDVRTQLYEHLQFLSVRFYDKRQMGSVISRVNQDTSQLQRFLVWGAQDLGTNLLLIVGIGTMLFVLNWKLALLVFVPAPVIGFASVKFWRRIRNYMHRFFDRWGKLNAVLTETLSGQKVVKAFAQEQREIGRFSGRSMDLAVTGIQAERAWAFLFSAMTFLTMLGTLFVWYFGGRDVLGGEMKLGTLMAYLGYVGMFYHPVQAMSFLLNWSSRSLTAAERVFEVLDAQPDVHEPPDALVVPRVTGHVEFRHVTFGYDPHKKVLKDVSFEARPGEMIGLVGHSGAGKSTTINLLCRFYDVDEGEILIDGIPIRNIRISDLRRQLGIVPQDTFLFSGSIAENIAYAKPDATREEIIRAAKIANAHDFILRKPDGYETPVGERGQALSAGERQRIAIARAVLHDPRILILDEATSHVDIETEKQIQEAIERLVEGRTTFAIAHRLSTLKNADRLIVLKDGAISEIGSHAELIEKDGEFARLVKMYQEISRVSAIER